MNKGKRSDIYRKKGRHFYLRNEEIELRERIYETVKALNQHQEVDDSFIPEPKGGKWIPERYYYDADAVREDAKYGRREIISENAGIHGGSAIWDAAADSNRDAKRTKRTVRGSDPSAGRNRRTVWHIATAPYSGAHFATYPPALVEPCIKAGTSERGVCPECGAPWERVTEKDGGVPGSRQGRIDLGIIRHHEDGARLKMGGNPQRPPSGGFASTTTLDWRPICEHDAEPVSAVVFDPFAGSGTTLQVARALGRHGVGLDLSAEYLQLARTRLELDRLDAWAEGAKKDGKPIDDLPMFKEMG